MKKILAGETGSILVTTLLSVTILTMLCATSLYITAQNASTTMQTASWQQALDAAESAMNWGIVAINNQVQGNPNWQGWLTAVGPMPSAEPSAGLQASGSPPADGSKFNYLIPANIISVGEGSNVISGWVMLDTGGGTLPLISLLGGGQPAQWYRIRATGVAYISGLRRVSNDKLDSNLRNTISLFFDRKTGVAIPTVSPGQTPQYQFDQAPQVTRSIEVVMKPVSSSTTAYTSLTKNQFNMSGGATVYGDIAILDTRKIGSSGTTSDSDLKSTYLYGNLIYSGPPVKNTNNVQGTISTPFTAPTPTPAPDPIWAVGTYTSMSFSSSQTVTPDTLLGIPINGTKSIPKKIKMSGGGDLTVPGGTVLTFAAGTVAGLPVDTYYQVWVPGALTVSGSGQIVQQPKVHVTFYIDGQITMSGGAVANGNNKAFDVANNTPYLQIDGNWVPSNLSSYTPLAATFSGSSNFYGVVNAPFYGLNISGSSIFNGSFIGDTMTLSGQAQLHSDASLSGSASGSANYAYASWFEDNSDVMRGAVY
jgi:hypothetical protein